MDLPHSGGGALQLHLLRHHLLDPAVALPLTSLDAAHNVHLSPACPVRGDVPGSGRPQPGTARQPAGPPVTMAQLEAAIERLPNGEPRGRIWRCTVCWTASVGSPVFDHLDHLRPFVWTLTWSSYVDDLFGHTRQNRYRSEHLDVGLHRFLTLLGNEAGRDLRDAATPIAAALADLVASQRERLRTWRPSRYHRFLLAMGSFGDPDPKVWCRFDRLSLGAFLRECEQIALSAFGAAEQVQPAAFDALERGYIGLVPRPLFKHYRDWSARQATRPQIVQITDRAEEFEASHLLAALALEPDLDTAHAGHYDLLVGVRAAMAATAATA